MQIKQPKNMKAKMRERKLISCVNWQGALKQKGLKICVKQVFVVSYLLSSS